MITKNCLKCNTEFDLYPSKVERKFCSRNCNFKASDLKYTDDVKNKMKEIKKEQYQNGLKPWNTGISVKSNNALEIWRESRDGKPWNWGGIGNIRNQRLKENGGSHTIGDWENLLAQYNWTCPCCKWTKLEVELVKDHIIPIAKGGSNNIENIQPLCRSCNAKKHTRIIKFDY